MTNVDGDEDADTVGRSDEFARASDLYDVEDGQRVQWDWGKMQPIAESQAEVETAVGGLSAGTPPRGGRCER